VIYHDDDDDEFFPQDKVDGLVAELRGAADERHVAQLIKELDRAGRKRDGLTRASVLVACARVMAQIVDATPVGNEVNAYVSVHALIDSYLHEADADRDVLH
jgi:hypothetical protein